MNGRLLTTATGLGRVVRGRLPATATVVLGRAVTERIRAATVIVHPAVTAP